MILHDPYQCSLRDLPQTLPIHSTDRRTILHTVFLTHSHNSPIYLYLFISICIIIHNYILWLSIPLQFHFFPDCVLSLLSPVVGLDFGLPELSQGNWTLKTWLHNHPSCVNLSDMRHLEIPNLTDLEVTCNIKSNRQRMTKIWFTKWHAVMAVISKDIYARHPSRGWICLHVHCASGRVVL
jgi:hypothetical protein